MDWHPGGREQILLVAGMLPFLTPTIQTKPLSNGCVCTYGIALHCPHTIAVLTM